MNTKQAGVPSRSDVSRSADVGRKHGLFDQPVGVGAGARHDALDAAVVVANDLRLSGFEVDRTALGALLEQGTVDVVQMQQMRQYFGAALGLGPAGIGQRGCHLGIGEAGVGVDDGRKKLVGVNAAVNPDDHVAGHRQPVLLRHQRAQAVGDFFRQHGNHPARKVHRGGALVGVIVKRLTGFDVVAHVGNGHDETPAFEGRLAAPALEGLAVHGVVEIAGVFTVDSDQWHVAQVDAMLAVDRAQFVWQGSGGSQRGWRKQVRHLKLAHGNFDLHARIVYLTQHLADPAHRLRVQGRRLSQFDRHHLPGCRTRNRVLRNQDVLTIAAVFWGNDPLPAFVQQAPDDGRLAALDNVQHAALRPALAVQPQHLYANAVTVQH